MPSVGLVLALGLTIGLAAQSCDVIDTGLTIDDLTDHIVVTNASVDQDASLRVTTSVSSLDFDLASGTSGTLSGLAARKYTIEVFAGNDPSGLTYRQRLVELRDKLVTLSLHPENPSADVAGALLELSTVEAALEQMHESAGSQTCSAPIKTGVDGKVTVTWNPAGLGGAGVWALSCQ
jgi:hypothetical protein